MYISHSVMEGQRHNNPLTRIAFVYKAQKGIVEVAKALGGSFKLVMPAPKPVREMTQLLRVTQSDKHNTAHTDWYKTSIQLYSGVKVGSNAWERPSQARHFCNLAFSGLKEHFFFRGNAFPGRNNSFIHKQ